MKLDKYDNKRVRITTDNNDIYEGIVYHNSKDYNYHEYGVNEEGLQMIYFLFYKSQIKKVEIIDKYTSSYGRFEIETVDDSLDFIDEVLYSEEDESIYRLLVYLKTCIDKLDYKEKLKDLLKKSLKYNTNKDINLLLEDLLSK